VTLATNSQFADAATTSRFFDNSAIHIRELSTDPERLGVDHIDLYYVHRITIVPIEDTIGELARLVKAGAIVRSASPRSPRTPLDALMTCIDAAVQFEYSLWTRNPNLA